MTGKLYGRVSLTTRLNKDLRIFMNKSLNVSVNHLLFDYRDDDGISDNIYKRNDILPDSRVDWFLWVSEWKLDIDDYNYWSDGVPNLLPHNHITVL